jgi:hypothetical protein
MLGAAEGGEFDLKCTHLGPQNELAMVENTGDRGIDRGTKTSALRTNVNKRNWRRIGSKIHQTVRDKATASISLQPRAGLFVARA